VSTLPKTTSPVERLSEERSVSLLVQRMGEVGDMPGFSKAVQSIMSAMAETSPQEANMAQAVLSDVALTQKVLHLANSAMYAAFGGTVNTVSKAVLLLGTETVGHLALGLKVLDALQQVSPDCQASHAEMSKAILASQVARSFAGDIASYRDAEEAAVCGMLHGLGRVLVSFYLPQHWAMIASDENSAAQDARAVEWLGASLETVGRSLAERLGMPRAITRTIAAPNLTCAELPLNHEDWLTAVSAFSTEAAGALVSAHSDAEVQALTVRYGAALGADPAQLAAAVRAAHQLAVQDNLLTGFMAQQEEPVAGKPSDSITRLRQGVHDLQEVAGTASPSQLISMTLETLHQAFGFAHSFAFVRQPQQFVARMGLGPGVQERIPKLAFDVAYEPHVFHASLSRDMSVFIENAHAPQLLDKIPKCWRDTMGSARSFLLVPLTMQGRPFGLLVGAWDEKAGSARVTPEEMALVNEMRLTVASAMTRRRAASEVPAKMAA
jgi:HD-like signal output (HDOD) protein